MDSTKALSDLELMEDDDPLPKVPDPASLSSTNYLKPISSLTMIPALPTMLPGSKSSSGEQERAICSSYEGVQADYTAGENDTDRWGHVHHQARDWQYWVKRIV